jgi:hypothetical protein
MYYTQTGKIGKTSYSYVVDLDEKVVVISV